MHVDFNCHVRFIQCLNCSHNYGGCCSISCKRKYEMSLHEMQCLKSMEGSIEGRNQRNRKAQQHNNEQQRHLLSRRIKNNNNAAKSSNTLSQRLIHTERPQTILQSNNREQLKEHASSTHHTFDALNLYCERYSQGQLNLNVLI